MAKSASNKEVQRRKNERGKDERQRLHQTNRNNLTINGGHSQSDNNKSSSKAKNKSRSKNKAMRAKAIAKSRAKAKAESKAKAKKQGRNNNTVSDPILISDDEDDYTGGGAGQDRTIYSISDDDYDDNSDDNDDEFDFVDDDDNGDDDDDYEDNEDDNDDEHDDAGKTSVDAKVKNEEDYISLGLLDEEDDTKPAYASHQSALHGRKRQREDYPQATNEMDEADLSIFYPWWRSYTGHPDNRLQEEVENFVNYLQPEKHEILLRHYLVHKIRYIIQEQWPGASVEVFGSFKTNTFLPDSDMDLAVSLPVYQGKQSLYALSSDLKRAGACLGNPEVIASATVPVIKFVEALTHLKVDIIVSSTNGVECAEYVSDALDRYPGARKLTLIAKHMVALRHLNEVFTGGIGGYGLVCMVISFLQMHPKVAAGMIVPDDNLGVLLLDFLQLYGVQFNIGHVGISIVGSGSYYNQRSVCARNGRPVFSIEDPLNKSNDVGCKSFNASAVVKMFRNAYLTTFTRTLGHVSSSRAGRAKFSRSSSPSQSSASPSQSSASSSNNTCLLSSGIGLIPETMVNQRRLMYDIHSNRRWKNEPASRSFDWNMTI